MLRDCALVLLCGVPVALIEQSNTSLRASVLGPHPANRGGVSGELLRVSRAVSLTPTESAMMRSAVYELMLACLPRGCCVSHRRVSALVSAWPPLSGSIQNVPPLQRVVRAATPKGYRAEHVATPSHTVLSCCVLRAVTLP